MIWTGAIDGRVRGYVIATNREEAMYSLIEMAVALLPDDIDTAVGAVELVVTSDTARPLYLLRSNTDTDLEDS